MNIDKNIWFILMLMTTIITSLLLINIVSAQLIGTYQQEYDVKRACINNGTYCSSSSVCNITITYPDGTSLVSNKRMTNQLVFHNYTLSSSTITQIGAYQVLMMCNDNGLLGSESFEFEITGNGKESPSGAVVVLFSILFIIFFATLVYLLIYSIGHLIALDFDVLDVAKNWGALFALYAILLLSKTYLGNPTIENIMDKIITVAIWTNGIVPILAFVLTMTIGTLVRNKQEKGEYYNE